MAMLLDDVNDYNPRCASASEDPEEIALCPRANDGFSSLSTALYTMATVATDADIPDMQLPSYSHSRPMGLAWMVFYVVGNFFLLNLVLAQVYSCYRENLTEFVLSFFRNRAKGLKAAYESLTEGNKVLDLQRSSQNLVKNINQSEVLKEIPIQHVRYLFHSLDLDHSGYIDLKEVSERRTGRTLCVSVFDLPFAVLRPLRDAPELLHCHQDRVVADEDLSKTKLPSGTQKVESVRARRVKVGLAVFDYRGTLTQQFLHLTGVDTGPLQCSHCR
mmetsp:Transcript_10195/g.20903  ORF Transcript_10195/g.20903 Transcript_10195/m.20903 type:complete len:274 (+) Transcript_10195:938-1759(+)